MVIARISGLCGAQEQYALDLHAVLAGNLFLSLKQDGDTKIGDIGMTKVPGLATWR